MKICPNCGMSSEDTQKFCGNCGSPLNEAPAPAEETAAPEIPVTPEETIAAEEAVREADIPAEETAARPEKPAKTKKEKKKVGVGRRILAVLLSILLFIFLLAPALGYAVRRATTEQGLTAVMEDLDLADMQAAPFFDDVTEEITLSELLSEDLAKEGLKIGESSVAKILNSSGMKGYLAGQIAPVCADVYRGKSTFEFDPQTLKDELLEGKTSRVLQKEKVELSDEEADKVVNLLTRYGIVDFLSRDWIKDDLPELSRAMNIGLSYVTIIGLLVVALLLIVLIFLVNRGRFGLSFGDIGGTALAVGLLLTLGAGFARILPGVWQKICGGQELAAAAGGGVLIHNIGISLIVLGSGLVLAILGRLLRGKKHKEPVEE
ncbi:MAG: zinc-ribbon domain-containing protein [Clostridia bacterium]